MNSTFYSFHCKVIGVLSLFYSTKLLSANKNILQSYLQRLRSVSTTSQLILMYDICRTL